MLIIKQRITQVQLGLLPSGPKITSRHCWNKLKELYGWLDVHTQFALMDKVSSLHLKDHNDCDHYLSEFSLVCSQFSKMGIDYTELQAVHALIKWLPTFKSWTSFTQITNTYVGKWVHSEARKTPADHEPENALWANLMSRLSQECLHLSNLAMKSDSKKKNGPGSKYASYSSNIVIQQSKQNPNGIKCTNCNSISHDTEHCFAPNGGMAGLHEAFLNKTGQFARPTKKSDSPPVITVFTSDIRITPCEEPLIDPTTSASD